MNIPVAGSLLQRFFVSGGAAAVVVLAACCVAAAPNPVSGPKSSEGYQTGAAHAMLIEAGSGSVLFEKAADDLIPPASLSKLMTQEVVFNLIKQGRLKATDEFIVSTNAWRRGGAPSHTSSMFIPIHSKVSVDDLLHGAIIQSANDACIALAEGISGSESSFAELMTKRARELGLTKSTFGNSTGLPDPRQLMTARELAKLARHIVESYPDYYKYYSEREFTWNKIRQFNRNPLLNMNLGADGLKTGFTKEAGYGAGRPEDRHAEGLARGIRCARGPAASGGKRGHRLYARTRLRRRDRTGARPVPGWLQAAIIATASIIDAPARGQACADCVG